MALFLVFQVLLFLHESESLSCFQCSNLANGGNPCPNSKSDVTVWSKQPGAYVDNPDNTETPYACALGYDRSEIVFYQATVLNSTCQGTQFQTTIIIKINQNSDVGEGRVKCCSKDGCNWNYTTSSLGMSFSEIVASNGNHGSSVYTLLSSTDWIPILIVIIILILILMCCFIYCCFRKRKKDKAKEKIQGTRPHVIDPNDFEGRGDVAVTPIKRIKAISVAEQESRSSSPINARDQERYSAIDAKLYRRTNERVPLGGVNDYKYHQDDSGLPSSKPSADPVTFYTKERIGKVSKEVFSNDEFQKANNTVTPEELRMPRKGKDWVHIWKSATEPGYVEKGSDVNAFRYNSS